MGKSSLSRRGRSFGTDWLAGIAAVLALLVLQLSTDLVGGIERRLYGFAADHSQRQPSDRIVIIAIDAQSRASIGPEPWPREMHAQLIDQLSAGGAKTIVYAEPFLRPQPEGALPFIRKMREALQALPQGRDGIAEQLGRIVAEAQRTLDGDARLAASMARAGNVLLSSIFELGDPLAQPVSALPAYVAASTIPAAGVSAAALGGRHPIEPLARAAAGVGHANEIGASGTGLNQHPLLINYGGRAVPSTALLAAAHSLDLSLADIKIVPGESVQLGKLRVATDSAGRMRPHFYPARSGQFAFPVHSFGEVLSGKIPAGQYAGKIVVVGATGAAGGSGAPGEPVLASAETMAHAISSILRGHFVVQPAWSNWAALAAALLAAVYLVALLPRLSAARGAAATALAIGLLAAGEFLLLSAAGLWLQFMFAAAVLAIGQLALWAKRCLPQPRKLAPDGESGESHHLMGLALHGQGQLDAAFERFRQMPLSAAVMDDLYNLALDFERKRQFEQARGVFEHIAGFDPNFKDVASRLRRAADLQTVQPAAASPGAAVTARPMLGRYLVERELGKGSMGVVYLGRDPKIGRVVAIKTMALSEEYEGEDLIEARARFFREAQTAGRLQHQHIVTIFDAGEEHDLAYIAMEFLKGKDLAEFCQPGRLLPVPRVLSIAARVAQALAYAHEQGVVHRDIKPANIMYEPETDTVKVTDFGIARVTDSSRTRTGLVLGTPSFMSPEQIAGKKVDGRSDLYSLGVMLFQMLAGVLPLRGESIAELMHKIAHEQAPDIRLIRPDIPGRLADIVALALSKRPETRYQDGDQLAADLELVLADLEGTSAGATAVGSASAWQPRRPMPAAARGSDQTVAVAAASAVAAILHGRGAAGASGPGAGCASGRGPAPGYDPGEQADAGAGRGAYARTAVMRRPSTRVVTGDDKTDLEA